LERFHSLSNYLAFPWLACRRGFGVAALHETFMAQTGGWRVGRACPLCPGISDINLFRYCRGVIDFDAEIPDRAFDLGMPEQ
jgi:hypothetical protein